MLTTLGLAFLTSHVTEVIVAINRRLQGTVLQGDAAFLLALFTAFIAALVKVFYIDGTPLPAIADFSTWQSIAPQFGVIWTIMQIYFLYVVKNLGLDVLAPQPPAPTYKAFNGGGGVASGGGGGAGSGDVAVTGI